MIDKILKVKDMPPAVREACIKRGFGLNSELTIQDAMAEWTAWRLGDRYWGYVAAKFVSDMATPGVAVDNFSTGELTQT